MFLLIFMYSLFVLLNNHSTIKGYKLNYRLSQNESVYFNQKM